MSDTNINTKPSALCTPPSGTVTLTETTTDNNVYKWDNNICYIRWRKMIEKLHKKAFVE